MKTQDFHYELPERLIAKRPPQERRSSRLLELDPQKPSPTHLQFEQLVDRLQPGDRLVFNNTKVIPARWFGQKETGGRVEVLLERLLDQQRFLAHVRASKSPKPGAELIMDGGARLKVTARHETLFELALQAGQSFEGVLQCLEQHGHMPLPPYIDRQDDQDDRSRYQTVYASQPGAVAAPTAGLHFDDELLAALESRGVSRSFVTLHVGAGTFQPVRCDDIRDHQMHSEWLEVSSEACEEIAATKAKGGRIIAVGTTSVRCLETASASGDLRPYCGDTQIFIYPGYQFKCVDGLITNFHLPESTLIMLVSALAGRDRVLEAYAEAVRAEYRFFSYGDAMLVWPTLEA